MIAKLKIKSNESWGEVEKWYTQHMSSLLNNTLLRSRKVLPFAVMSSGWHVISISGRVKSEKQRGTNETDDEELIVKIDDKTFPKLGTKQALFNSPAAFNGGELHNKEKTVYFLIQLEKGEHVISLEPQHEAEVIDVSYEAVSFSDNQISLTLNKQAEDRDRKSWMTFVLVDSSLQSCTLEATIRWHWFDGDDIKVIVNGTVQTKINTSFRKDLLFTARPILDIFGRTQTEILNLNLLKKPFHYIELIADKSPTIITVSFYISEEVRPDMVRKYTDKIYGRDYNKLDEMIKSAVSYWNTFFLKQTYLPKEPLDPNLVKAIIYRESKLGYFPNENIIDVMQVWDEANPAKDAILGKAPANEFVNENKYGHMSYSYPVDRTPPQVTTHEESIFWGVRWLFHKAQEFAGTGEDSLKSPYRRGWVSWEEAVRRYNANPKLVEEYVSEVFSVYRNGVDTEGNILWIKEE